MIAFFQNFPSGNLAVRLVASGITKIKNRVYFQFIYNQMHPFLYEWN